MAKKLNSSDQFLSKILNFITDFIEKKFLQQKEYIYLLYIIFKLLKINQNVRFTKEVNGYK